MRNNMGSPVRVHLIVGRQAVMRRRNYAFDSHRCAGVGRQYVGLSARPPKQQRGRRSLSEAAAATVATIVYVCDCPSESIHRSTLAEAFSYKMTAGPLSGELLIVLKARCSWNGSGWRDRCAGVGRRIERCTRRSRRSTTQRRKRLNKSPNH
jgi:hypothetical protein